MIVAAIMLPVVAHNTDKYDNTLQGLLTKFQLWMKCQCGTNMVMKETKCVLQHATAHLAIRTAKLFYHKTEPVSCSLCPWGLSDHPAPPLCPCQNSLACSHHHAAGRSDHPGDALSDAVVDFVEAGVQAVVYASPPYQFPPCISAGVAHKAAPAQTAQVWSPRQGRSFDQDPTWPVPFLQHHSRR